MERGQDIKVIIKVSDLSEVEEIAEKMTRIRKDGFYDHLETIIEADLRKKLFPIF